MLHRVNAERVVLLGWGRAILLQVAHPLVAAAVDQHSDYGSGLRAYLTRTRRTVGAMLQLTFGTAEEVQAAADRINGIHHRVHGRLVEPSRRFPAGTPYSATDPELLRWVHTTLIDSQVRAYELFVEPLSLAERDRYCAEAAALAPLLELPDDYLPASAAAVRQYLDTRYRDDTVEVGDTARRLARGLLHPPGGLLTAPVFVLGRLATVGLLPPAVRDGYRFDWGARRERRLRRAAAAIRRARAMLPSVAREWSVARAARRPPLAGCPLH